MDYYSNIDWGCSIQWPFWNGGRFCDSMHLGILLFESQDFDFNTRIFSPMTITNPLPSQNEHWINVLNTFMDHGETFLSGQYRRSRFPTMVMAPGLDREDLLYRYDVVYTGTVPKWQRFKLTCVSNGIMVRICYHEQNSYEVSIEHGNKVEANAWDDSLLAAGELTGRRGCGENRYIGGENILEFYLTPECTIEIRNRDIILASKIRMDWTMEEFFADGGSSMFIDRLSNILGIKPKDIKIAGISYGSIIIEFTIVSDEDDVEALTTVKTLLDEILSSNTTALGAPILDVETSELPEIK